VKILAPIPGSRLLALAGVIAYFNGATFAQQPESPQVPKAPFTLSLAAESPTTKIGLPVWVKVTLKNTSNHDLKIEKEISEDLCTVVVQEATLQMGFATRRASGIGSLGIIGIQPGKTVVDRVNVSRMYDLTRPGKYTIQAQRSDDVTKAKVLSNKITVTVTD
jgi:hypothetical protein